MQCLDKDIAEPEAVARKRAGATMDAHRYHVLGDEFTRPNTCVDLLRNDVGEPVVDHNLNVDVGVLW